MKRNIESATILALAALLLAGCSTSQMTNPPRSVTEQLLLSTAADRAINTVSFINFDHKKVFVDGTYYESYDSKYVLGSIRDALSRFGGAPGKRRQQQRHHPGSAKRRIIH